MIEELNYIQVISDTLNIQQKQVEVVLDLILEWSTVPFIARYRKERTWDLDETQIREILEIKQQEENLFKAKNTALNGIEEKWKLTEELKNNTMNMENGSNRGIENNQFLLEKLKYIISNIKINE